MLHFWVLGIFCIWLHFLHWDSGTSTRPDIGYSPYSSKGEFVGAAGKLEIIKGDARSLGYSSRELSRDTWHRCSGFADRSLLHLRRERFARQLLPFFRAGGIESAGTPLDAEIGIPCLSEMLLSCQDWRCGWVEVKENRNR